MSAHQCAYGLAVLCVPLFIRDASLIFLDHAPGGTFGNSPARVRPED